MSELNLLKQELFGNRDSAIFDIKFHPGTTRGHSPEDIAGTLRIALQALRNGECADIDLAR